MQRFEVTIGVPPAVSKVVELFDLFWINVFARGHV
jgi:hypothetical protein